MGEGEGNCVAVSDAEGGGGRVITTVGRGTAVTVDSGPRLQASNDAIASSGMMSSRR